MSGVLANESGSATPGKQPRLQAATGVIPEAGAMMLLSQQKSFDSRCPHVLITPPAVCEQVQACTGPGLQELALSTHNRFPPHIDVKCKSRVSESLRWLVVLCRQCQELCQESSVGGQRSLSLPSNVPFPLLPPPPPLPSPRGGGRRGGGRGGGGGGIRKIRRAASGAPHMECDWCC